MNFSRINHGLYAVQNPTIVLTLCFLLNTFTVFGDYTFDTGDFLISNSGYFGFEYRHFLQDPIFEGQNNQWSKFEGDFDLSISHINGFGIRINPRILFSFEDESLVFMHPDNLYAYYQKKGMTTRAGTQIFSWSLGRGAQPADFLNQTYKRVNVLTPQKDGELSLDVSYDFGTNGKHGADIVFLPYFTPSEYPLSSSRYFILGEPAQSRLSFPDEGGNDYYQDSSKRWRPQGAVRWFSQFADHFSMSLFYFNGYEKLPGFIMQYISRELWFEHRLVHLTGLNLKGGNDAWSLYLECVRNDYHKAIRRSNSISFELAQIQPYYQFLFGTEYNLRNKLEWKMVLEVFGDTDKDREPEDFDQFKPLRNCVYLGVEKIMLESNVRGINAGFYLDYFSYDGVIQVFYTEKIFDHFILKAAYEDVLTVNNKEKDPFASHLKPLRTTRRVSAEAVLMF